MAFPRIDLGSRRSRMISTALIVAGMSCIIVFSTSVEAYLELRAQGEEALVPWMIFRYPLLRWLGWVIAAPFCFELAWKYRLERGAWGKPLAVLILGNVIVYVWHVGYQLLTMLLPTYRMVHPDFMDALQFHTITSLHLNFFFYWCIVATAHFVRIHHGTQQRALRAARLESELANAHLDALKMQLHPHFLFNTLHGISTLMYRDVEKADQMVSRLSSLLRRTLERSRDHLITLREELDLLREYLAIEEVRFGERMRVDFRIDESLHDARVPSFVFQPLVENAIKHGIAAAGNRGTIEVGARRSGDRIVLSVADDGPGLNQVGGAASADEALGAGVGLSNLHDRLTQLYGSDFSLDLIDRQPNGLEVRFDIPM